MTRRRMTELFGSIRGQLMLSFLLIGLVPLALVLWVAYDAARDGMEHLAFDRLAATARGRTAMLERVAAEHLRGLDAVVRAPGFIASCRDCAEAHTFEGPPEPSSSAGPHERAREFLAPFADAYRYEEVLLLSPSGLVVFALRNDDLIGASLDDPQWKTSTIARAFERVTMLIEPEIVPTHAGQRDGVAEGWTVGPLLDGNQLAGVIAGKLAPAELGVVLSDRTGLGATGDVIAAVEVEAGRFMLTGPTRKNPDAAFRMQVSETDPLGMRLARAARGELGQGYSVGADGADVVSAWAYSPSFRWSITAEQDVSEALAPLARLRDAAFLSVVAVVVNVIALALAIARRIGAPLQMAVKATRRIAEGDLTQPVQVGGRGETRELLAAVRETNDDLAALVGRIQASTSGIVGASRSVREVARGQQEVARDFGASSSQIAAATNEMSATARELTATVTELARTATNAAETAGEGRGALSGLSSSMERLTAGATGVASRFTTVSMKAAQIDAVVAAITKVANQTNLLAVNAAIEAEKAGDAGLGFQVVAREIDRLATQAATSALEIESMVASMQEAVAEGVRELGHFRRTVEDGCATAHGANEGLSKVIRQVEELQASFTQVAQAVRSQSEGVSQVNEAMSMLTSGAQRTSAGAAASTQSSAALESAAQSLESEVSRFRVR